MPVALSLIWCAELRVPAGQRSAGRDADGACLPGVFVEDQLPAHDHVPGRAAAEPFPLVGVVAKHRRQPLRRDVRGDYPRVAEAGRAVRPGPVGARADPDLGAAGLDWRKADALAADREVLPGEVHLRARPETADD